MVRISTLWTAVSVLGMSVYRPLATPSFRMADGRFRRKAEMDGLGLDHLSRE